MIPLLLFPNVVLGLKSDDSIMLFIPTCSKLSSNDKVSLEICLSWTIYYDEILLDVLFITSVAYERHSVSGFRGAS